MTNERKSELQALLKDAVRAVSAARKAPIPTLVPSMRKSYRRSLVNDAQIRVRAIETAILIEA